MTDEPDEPLTLRQLSDLEALRTLKARYCRYTDAKRWGDVVALFTADAELAMYDAAGELTNSFAARDIPELVGGRIGVAQSIHHVFAGELDLTSASTATGVWALEDFMFRDPETEPDAPYRTRHGYGRYRETYRKVDSSWLIARLELHRIRIELTD